MTRFFIRQRIPLRVQGILYNSLPLIAILVTAVFAYFSNQQRERTEMSLNRHFEMVENLADIHTALLKAEAGLRGHLLTHDLTLLQPIADARTLIPPKLARVRTLMESIPTPSTRAQKLARLDTTQAQVNSEMDALANVSAASSPIAPPSDLSGHILHDQPLLDAAGQGLDALRTSEERLLSKRIDEIRSVRQRDYLLIFLSVFIGLVSRAVALYFFHRRVIRRVRQLTENVRSLRDGSALVHEPSGHADDIGELERELARVSEFLADRRISS
jgi:CHASE3 domain sensor protein